MDKDILIEYIKNTSQKIKIEELENNKELSANFIANKYGLVRNTISQYLNELVKEGILFKIQTRPVLFLYRKSIVEKYNLQNIEESFGSISEFKKAIADKNNIKNFEGAIGYHESLYNPIDQLKISANYPNNGLPVLINGPTGCGKSYLAQLMYEYTKDEGLISDEAPFVVLNCAEYVDNPELITANLFGYTKGAFTGAEENKIGLIEKANEGYLFLDEVHCLKPESQEKLFMFMDKGKFRRLGESGEWRQSKVRFIFATTENPEKVFLKTFLRRIPIIVHIPSLIERSEKERKQLIHNFLYKEAINLRKQIKISNQSMTILLKAKYSGNVGELKNCIKYACANAYSANKNKDILKILISHLPNNIFKYLDKELNINYKDNDNFILINEENNIINENERVIKLNKLYENIINKFNRLFIEQNNIEDCINNCLRELYNYYDYIFFKNEYNKITIKDSMMNKVMQNIFEIICNKYGIKISNNMIMTITEYLSESRDIKKYTNIYTKDCNKEVNKIYNFLQINYQKEFIISTEIVDLIGKNLDIYFDVIDKVILIINIISVNKKINNNRILGIILSHGYSTASSIADATNKMIGEYIFEAIDMPVETSTENVLTRLKSYLKRMESFKEIILLVDMGSLEEIYKGLEIFKDRTLGIINNITTKLALDIGFRIIQGEDIEKILIDTSQNIITKYRIIKPEIKRKAILTTCATGMGAAKKFAELMKSSLPKDIELEIMPYDFNKLKINGKKDEIFNKYEVELIIGTTDPKLDKIDFIPIEKIVLGKGHKNLEKYLKEFLLEEDLKDLNNKIIKNFTLQNLIVQLTILNADKIIDYSEDVINKLQITLGKKFNNNTIIGLYIHLCCLIERLVMNTPIKTYGNTDDFIENNKDFIKIVKDSFSVVEKTFSVEIPITEIGYIYDYVVNDKGLLE